MESAQFGWGGCFELVKWLIVQADSITVIVLVNVDGVLGKFAAWKSIHRLGYGKHPNDVRVAGTLTHGKRKEEIVANVF